MPRASIAQRRDRTRRLIDALRATYPDAHCELAFTNPLELLVATVLSAQCADQQVNRVTPRLFQTYRTAADYAGASLAELESHLRQLGLYRNKARNLQAAGRHLVQEHGGQVPRTLEELTRLPGVGRKTANVVLGNAFAITEGIVVDTHVARLSRRLGLTRESTPEKIERDLQALVPRDDWNQFSHWLIWHGRRRCAARRPDCAHCELADLCPSRETP